MVDVYKCDYSSLSTFPNCTFWFRNDDLDPATLPVFLEIALDRLIISMTKLVLLVRQYHGCSPFDNTLYGINYRLANVTYIS